MPRRVGIMGGTFDPVHTGHLRIAEEALEKLGLDCVLFVPAADPPHKSGRSILSFEHRWRMLELAVEGNPKFCLSDLERRLSGKSYSVNSLKKLAEECRGEAEFFFLVGLDAFLEIDTWWRFRELFELARMVVLRRPGYVAGDVLRFLTAKVSADFQMDESGEIITHPSFLPVYYLKNTRLDVSSTQIRRLVSEGRSIRYLVAGKVFKYIMENGVYKAGAGAARAREERHEWRK